jgi:peptidoglycan/LPS O-acetylase OafA/YrhL
MDPVSSLPAIVALTAAVTTSFILAKKFGKPPALGRFSSIDGLRGFLAFFVFLCHSCIWYFYLRTGKWEVPPSNLYTHFGQSSVALFFMITGFLFFSKLIDGRTKKIDWGKLFVSRFLRLVPLYLFAICLVFLLVFILSNWSLNESIPKLLMGMVRWLAFTVSSAPNLNGVENTWIIVAGVTWSLPYEWLYYFALPLLALTVGVLPPSAYIGLSVVCVAFLLTWVQPSIHYLSFIGGIATAFLVRWDLVRRFAVGNISSFIALACLAVTISFFPSANGVVPILLLTVFFVLVASGNSLFGFLLSPASRTLGDFAYGIYLIHGIALFVTFNFVLGLPQSRALSAIQHWSVVVGITPVLIFICFLTYKFIEHPAMQKATSVTTWLRSVFLVVSRFRRRARLAECSPPPAPAAPSPARPADIPSHPQ